MHGGGFGVSVHFEFWNLLPELLRTLLILTLAGLLGPQEWEVVSEKPQGCFVYI